MRDQGRIDTAAYHKNYRYIIDVLKSDFDTLTLLSETIKSTPRFLNIFIIF